MDFIKLIRVKHWVKNFFLFLPLFFSGEIFILEKIQFLIIGFFSFSAFASSIYVINDLNDIESDRLHPTKRMRPLASGAISKKAGLVIFVVLAIIGFGLGFLVSYKFLFVVTIYFLLNIGYSFGLKNISILDVMIVSAGFILRLKAGSIATHIPVSEWLMIMVFLLSLFMALAKRRDDLMIKDDSGVDVRKVVKNYNLVFINVCLAMFASIMVVAYLMYTMSPEVHQRFGSHRMYYTSVFVIGGILRYLQLAFVEESTGSPTKILYKDRFIQAALLLWLLSFYFFIYYPDIQIF